ncbi:hypothetical protein ACH4NF_20735 [Streptomyces sp. NPDC017248]|uniref:hypothetical protein n=1 Tax=unclassified Streptomyces TaxID=2593676 RepID=UPI0037895528
MLVALFAVAAEVTALVLYTVRRGRGADLPSLGQVDLRDLILAAMAVAAGGALTGNQDAGPDDLMALLLCGCLLPTQAGAAVSRMHARWSSAAWAIACAGGLAVGTLNQDAAWPWS